MLVLIGLAALALWALYRGLAALDPVVAAASIAGLVTVTGSVATVVLQRRSEQRQSQRSAQRERTIPLYQEFLEFWFERLRSGSQQLSDTDMQKLSDLNTRLVTWGSDRVLQAYAGLNASAASDKPGLEPMFRFEQLILEVRNDVGLANKGLDHHEVLRLFVTDFDEAVRGGISSN